MTRFDPPARPSTPHVPVLAAPFGDPGQGRTRLELPPGQNVEEILRHALPGLRDGDRRFLRVTLVSDKGMTVVDRANWARVRPHAGVQVVIRTLPGRDALRSVLLAVVTIAAIAVPAALGLAGTFTGALLGAGITVVGSLLINALIPARTGDSDRRNVYSISGWRNEVRPDEPVPYLLGHNRYAPPLAATTYTEIVGDQQYIRALFCFGYGPLELSEFRLGETPLEDYDDYEIETREGREADLPITLYPRQVLEDAQNIELVRPLPRDAAGELIGGEEGEETPVKRFTAADTETASVILSFPSGLFRVNDEGKVRARSVTIRIRQRHETAETWTDVVTLEVTAKKREAFWRQHTWLLPSRGRWQIEVTRMTDESTSTQVSDRSILAAIQSIRPEYPINMAKPLALVAMRVRATYQLNGTLDNFNGMARRYTRTFDGESWAEGLPRNPAAAYLAALTGPANPFPVADAGIDLELLADWHDWCAAKGLKYDAPHDKAESFQDMLAAICGAGRATPRHDGLRWTVVIDRPEELVVDHINPRNSSDFSWQRSYFDPPHAFRISFRDETNDYEEAERIVPWPDHTGEITLTESLSLPGKTDPDEIWVEARRRMYELLHRPDSFSATQSGGARVATRGDQVMASHDVLDSTQVSARVISVEGKSVELDEETSMVAGTTYGLRFRDFEDEDDTIGSSIVRPVMTLEGRSRLLLLTGDGEMPEPGMIVHFGPMATESLALRIRGIEGGEDFASILDMVAAAPVIDELTDAEVPPAWNGRVGDEVDVSGIAPAAPVFTSIASGYDGTGDPDGLRVLLAPGAGSTALLSAFEIDHRLEADETWATTTQPVAAGGGTITGYSSGDSVALRARAVASDGTEGPYTATITLTIGADDPEVPASLDDGTILVEGGLGHAAITLATAADATATKVQVYRVPAGDTLDTGVHAVGQPFAIAPSLTTQYVDGDGTRSNLLANPGFDDAGAWSLDSGWAIAAGLATHTPGTADGLSQEVSFTAGTWYRIAASVSGRTAGQVTVQFTGGTTQSGSPINADGEATQRLQAVSGNTTFRVFADSAFDGSIDDLVCYVETGASIPAGTWDYYLEPLSADNLPGPISGPFPAKTL